MEADRIVLGGLNEGVWPPDARSDAFLNRPMRADLGLAAPERRIGQSAHEFAQALGAPEAVIVRAQTVEGTPMVASRFLRRLDAFVGEAHAEAMRERGRYLLAAANALDAAPPRPPAERPCPKPAPERQPASLSITEIETLIRDPYAIYARHILGLEPLDPLQGRVDARDRGTILHAIVAAFIGGAQETWPADAELQLIECGRRAFEPYSHVEAVGAFWWPVFERVAKWFVPWEERRREAVRRSHVEVAGSLALTLADGASFTLRGRADRIDVLHDGSLAIVDYKTGQPPSMPQVASGLSPQLTLTAHMAAAGQFPGVPKGPVERLSYVKVGSRPAEIELALRTRDKLPLTVAEAAALHIEGLRRALDRLRSGEEGYLSRRMPEKVRDGGPYDHLARVREWMIGELD
jgi:ATP-dependent helicase/nuclease subunit B